VILEVNDKDSYFKTNEDQILRNIIYREDDAHIIFIGINIFINVEDFYTYPLNSSELGIVKVSELNDNKYIFTLKGCAFNCC